MFIYLNTGSVQTLNYFMNTGTEPPFLLFHSNTVFVLFYTKIYIWRPFKNAYNTCNIKCKLYRRMVGSVCRATFSGDALWRNRSITDGDAWYGACPTTSGMVVYRLSLCLKVSNLKKGHSWTWVSNNEWINMKYHFGYLVILSFLVTKSDFKLCARKGTVFPRPTNKLNAKY